MWCFCPLLNFTYRFTNILTPWQLSLVTALLLPLECLMNLVNLNSAKVVDKTDSHPALQCHLVDNNSWAISCEQWASLSSLPHRDSTQVLLTACLLLDKKGIYFCPLVLALRAIICLNRDNYPLPRYPSLLNRYYSESNLKGDRDIWQMLQTAFVWLLLEKENGKSKSKSGDA